MSVDAFKGEEGSLSTAPSAKPVKLIPAAGAASISWFAEVLFEHAAPEDLAHYSPEDIAALAEQGRAFLQLRQAGSPKIRFYNPASVVGSPSLGEISVVEIVNDDMPFLLDSVMAALADWGLSVRFVVHPVFALSRAPTGELAAIKVENGGRDFQTRESFIHIHVERIQDERRRDDVIQDLEQSLTDVRRAIVDWKPMLRRVEAAIADLESNPPPVPPEEAAEAVAFLEWLIDSNFTFVGIREHQYSAETSSFDALANSGLGILRDTARSTGRKLMTPEIRAVLDEPNALFLTKSASRCRVHRRVGMDYVGIKRYDANGTAYGELRILGLFTSTAYNRSTRSIPYVRKKIDAVLRRAGFNPSGHSGKALLNILENFPRDELFHIDNDVLYRFALAILKLEERPRVRAFALRDRFDRFVSAIVYLPRERTSGGAIEAIGAYLSDAYKSKVSSVTPFFPEGRLVRVTYILIRSQDSIAEPDRDELEKGIASVTRTWADALSQALAASYDTQKALTLSERYARAFPPGYSDRYAPGVAIEDIRQVEGLSSERQLSVGFYECSPAGSETIGLKIWSFNRPIPLSERVPILENMGFRVINESAFRISPEPADGPGAWLHDMLLERSDGKRIDITEGKSALETCLLAVMGGMAENDGYNALVLDAGLGWRDVALVRTVSRYLQQIRIAYSQDYMWATMRKHGNIAAQLSTLFQHRFDPHLALSLTERMEREEAIARNIDETLKTVTSLDEDRIIRHFVNVIRSTVRTNFYQADSSGQSKAQIVLKIDSRKIDGLPLPRPLYEIMVYSPRVEGIHLRFGKVARGGIRWSDRPQDFRTEVLGLVKAQQVKNAVIVPVGAKGGFVPRSLSEGGAAAEGIASYSLYVSAMLDVVDNVAGDGRIVPPENVVRHDGDDAYFVVAADKGTATFSDTANRISLDRGFWLGDAFASGGSAGYDHKAMGITARGAWEAVRRHFREADVDITTTPFTVAGVGDMSGDVFGNGMLLENTIKLVCAFDHRDIFIDPEPNPKVAFAERKRLFELQRSTWQDYDRSLISKGGGVFSRSSKEIVLSPEMRALLALEGATATPREIMNAILKMPVDLLWFGGIGTYVRSSDETDDAAGDRANDAIRVSGRDLRCKVIGEGANLGMTQRGRIEAGLLGVRLNTDAIDNSAGVNTSDVEVNIKIAFSEPLRSNSLILEKRDAMLSEMTDEVASLVLRNNYQQTLAISLAQRRGADDLGFQQRLIQTLEARGLLNRAVENLPDDVTIGERRRRSQGLSRPELAVLLAYSKLSLYGDILDTGVPDDPYLERELGRYFPQLLVQRFADAVSRHPLRREIIATHIVNSIINRGGPSLVVRMTDETGARPDAIISAFVAVRDSFDMPDLNTAIDALDNMVSGKTQLDLYAAVQDLLLDRLVWFLRNVDFSVGLSAVVDHYRNGITTVEANLDLALSDEAKRTRNERASQLFTAGVPVALAARTANLPALSASADIVLIGDRTKRALPDVAATYFAVRDFFKVDSIADAAQNVVITDYFDRLALDNARDALGEAARRLTAEMLEGGRSGSDAVEEWIASRADAGRIRDSVHEIAATGLTLSKLAVAVNLLDALSKK
ncbi:NAD-glutamate dehydrogenase [Sinorhizobium meliloti]|uniref:NAD-glutamate dehydrogenase n=1 Tax=Rhizobium meliloti TaxID=382 RepID=UPI003D65D0A9